jgi:hypothetical protein
MGRSRLAWKSLGVSRTCLSGSMEASERSEASHSVGLMPDGQLGLLQGLLRTECCRVLAHVPGFGFHVDLEVFYQPHEGRGTRATRAHEGGGC